jgi:hypothetical protein
MSKSGDLLRATVYDKKYTVVQDANGGVRALRHGEEWRNCVGDGLVLALAQEVRRLREGYETMARNRVTSDDMNIPEFCRKILRGSEGDVGVGYLEGM